MMGATKSKIAEPEDQVKHETGSIPSTPILTPKTSRENINEDFRDPRSPSRHIARTPIELLSSAAEKLHNLKLEEIEIDGTTSVLTPLKTHILLGIDPRSPTVAIERTPIIVSASPDKILPAKIRNKNLDKVKKAGLLDTPKRPVPPKLLDSTPVPPKPKAAESKRKSLVGLLETNIDFTETDLDAVIKEKYSAKELYLYDNIDDPRSPTTDFLRTPILITGDSTEVIDTTNINEEIPIEIEADANTEKEDENIELQESDVFECEEPCEDDNNKASSVKEVVELPEDGLDNASVSSTDHISESTVIHIPQTFELVESESVIEITKEERSFKHTEIKSVKSEPITPSNIINVTPKRSQSEPATPPVIDLTADTKEFDKKLTNLIYEDGDLVVCPRVVKIKEQNRTPLGIRNGNGEKTSTNKLKVSNKPRKQENVSSKIPVFKEKKIKVQCENTHPNIIKSTKGKKSQWDVKDDTMII